MTMRSLWRHPDFVKLWTGQTISELGSVVTRTALPIAAVITLHASAIEMGVLVACASVAVLLVGLAAGAVVDRVARRPLMIVADAGRAALLLSIPVAAYAGALRIEQLYAIAFLEAALGSFFDVAYRSYLPALLPPERLLDGNAKLGMTGALAELGGPGVGGALVQVFTAPIAMLVDGVSYVASAVSIALIGTAERAAARVETAAGLRREIADGLRTVWHEPILRAIALNSVAGALFGNFFASLYTLYAIDELGLSPLLLGIVISAGGVGSLAATVATGPLTRRWGLGPTIIRTRIAAAAFSVLMPLAGGPPLLAATFLFIPQLIGDAFRSVAIIDTLTTRQLIAPPRLLGRVNGTMHMLIEGVAPVGALVGAALAEAFGIRVAVWVAVLGVMGSIAFLVFSPLRTLRGVALAA